MVNKVEAVKVRTNEAEINPHFPVMISTILYDIDRKIAKCVIQFNDLIHNTQITYSCLINKTFTRDDFIKLEEELELLPVNLKRIPNLEDYLSIFRKYGFDLKENPNDQLITNVNIPNFLYMYKYLPYLPEEKHINY